MKAMTSVHRRKNILTGDWILVSPHRTQRPWQGQQENTAQQDMSKHDENCYLCPRNTRANGEKNLDYDDTFVFTNDYSAMLQDNNENDPDNRDHLFQQQKAQGECRVICFSKDHSQTMASMNITQIEKVVNLWKEQYKELSKKYKWVQIFENKGSVMGCSNPHPHGQVWASDFLPNEARKETKNQKKYFKEQGSKLLLDYAFKESNLQQRVVCENSDWIVVVPFWAVWPFETLLLPKISLSNFNDMKENNKKSLAKILKEILVKYDKLFDTSFPFSMGWHGLDKEFWQLHAHFYPPLLRSATVKKFMVGYELLAEYQRDITAETAAQQLKDI